MLNRDKVAQDIQNLSEKIFFQQQSHEKISLAQWHDMVSNPLFEKRITQARASFSLARWQDSLTDIFPVKKLVTGYTVLAVDGSQVYPDRHISGISCFLLNAGGCLLHYGKTSKAILFSEPHVCIPEDVSQDNNQAFSVDLVDLKREALELEVAFKRSVQVVQEDQITPYICLFDGSLIFWHLEAKPPEVCDLFLKTYVHVLNQFYEKKIIFASYVSLPKSKELVHLVKIGTCGISSSDTFGCDPKYQKFPCQDIDLLSDSHVLDQILMPGFRSTIFFSNAKIVEYYPEHLKPCFFYVNIGKEIVRIEFPKWVLDQEQENGLELISSICFDQAIKGYGYPVALAEAHEQAVIKSPDRDFFYHMLSKAGIMQKHNVIMSQKSLKKRHAAV